MNFEKTTHIQAFPSPPTFTRVCGSGLQFLPESRGHLESQPRVIAWGRAWRPLVGTLAARLILAGFWVSLVCWVPTCTPGFLCAPRESTFADGRRDSHGKSPRNGWPSQSGLL